MDYVNLGESGLKVSRACLGAMNFGTSQNAPCNEAQAKRIIDAFLGQGHNFIDTANVYQAGQSEVIVGHAIKEKRHSVILATKARGPQGSGPNDMGTSRLHLNRALDESLKRLDTDYIDLYQMHAWDPDTPIEETMATLDSFVQAGKVRYIGCSNYTGSQIVEAQWAASRQKGTPFIALQPRYSLLARDIEADVLPACQRHGLGTLVYSPLAGGMLTGKYKQGEEPAADTRFGRRNRAGVMGTLNDRNFEIVNAVEQAAGEIGATASAVSIAWCLTRRGVTSVIIGPRTLQQQEECLEGYELELSEMLVKGLSDASRPAGRR
ncbi:MAG: aldo/keto reductase [Pseudomonadales bacterium]|nr:aldo/keto reductase [Pseudomonadales bacterium]MDP7597972.1 aldo/keto reductase [Pseudomonadales bacterium]HJN52649.1 aldo/keto reductase [Pseudomonadales bacterium]|tara:strand:- start:15993 stop:16958 length:966 start_codon:yes stop_codon:yes gene_type:complete